MSFKKGNVPHNKNKKGYTNSGSFKEGHIGYGKGIKRLPFSEEWKNNMSKAHKNNIREKNGFWGKHHSEKAKKKMSELKKGKKRVDM